jgi:hypothetical protein
MRAYAQNFLAFGLIAAGIVSKNLSRAGRS